MKPIVDVIIPAYNEAQSIGRVLDDIPKEMVRHIIVCNNNSSDQTAEIARDHGAIVVDAPQKGYGSACLSGMNRVESLDQQPHIVVFLDGDYSDHPNELPFLIQPILDKKAQLVIGSRALGNLEDGAMQPQQIFGNWLATHLIRLFYKVQFTDLGPFRAVDYRTLLKLKMADPNYGWTVEMQVKAAKMKIPVVEVPVSYRQRIGKSKVSGTIKGTILAGHKIIWTIFKHL